MMNGLVRRSWMFLPGMALALVAPVRSQTLTPPPAFPGTVEGATSAPQAATLQNGESAALTINSITVSGDFKQQTSGGTCPQSPATLAGGASCIIMVTFAPKATGTLSGTLTVTDSTGKQTAPLTGTGDPSVTLNPTSLPFKSVPIGQTSTLTVTLTNNQATSLKFTSILTSGVAFAISSNTCGTGIGPSPASCQVGVKFSPTTIASFSGKLTFKDNAADSAQQVVNLSGSGAADLVSIAVTPTTPTIYVGSTQQFTATGTYSNGTTKNISTSVTWSATPPSIATISTAGLATGTAAGSTVVTAALGAITNTIPVTLTVIQLFAPTGSLITARYFHTATLLTSGLVLTAGGIGPVPGETGALGELSSAELYNPVTGVFTATTEPLNVAREQQTATLLNSGTVLLAGGSGGDGELNSAELYEPATGKFVLTNPLNTARYEHTATALPSGGVLIAGGYGGGAVLASAELYNPATRKFTTTNSLNTARFGATATLLPNGLVLIAGGADETGPLSSAELYDPTLGTFAPSTNTLNVARSFALATLLDTGEVLISDGYNYSVTGPLTSAELYNPTLDTFTPTSSQVATSYLGTITLLGNADVLVAGSVLNSASPELYTPSPGFSITSQMITPRDLQTATLLPDGAVLMAGGHSNVTNTVLAVAELYEPTTLAPPDLSSIAITPSSVPSLAVGGSQQLVATGTFGSAGGTQVLASVTWTSSNPAVATVTDDITNSGVVFGVSAGTTNVSACTGTICGVVVVTVAP
jgi:uncharacterized protein YjdB